MGSSKSKVVPVLSEDEIEEKSSCSTETNGTSCWEGIKNLFSRNTKVVPLEPDNDAEDHDDKKNDDDDLVQNSTTAQVPPTAAIVTVEPESPRRHILKAILNELICQNIEPINCQVVKSRPLIGQKGKRPVRVRPSTSYPADRRVSTWDFLYYHRFVNDDSENESYDEESSDDDDDDADIESDDDEIDDRIRVHRFTHRAACKAKVNRGKGGKTKKAKGAFHVSNETRSLIGQKMDTMVDMNDDVSKHTEESSSDYLSSSSLANDVTSDDGASSEVDDVFVEENDFLFMVSLSWITHVNISVAFALLWAFVDIDRKMENGMDEKVVVDRKETGDHTPSGHPTDEEYPPDFETDSETDIDQPSTSYKRDKHATYDFIVKKRFMDVSSDEYIW